MWNIPFLIQVNKVHYALILHDTEKKEKVWKIIDSSCPCIREKSLHSNEYSFNLGDIQMTTKKTSLSRNNYSKQFYKQN